MTRLHRLLLAAALSGASLFVNSLVSAHAQNIVTNGSFENTGGTWVDNTGGNGGMTVPVGSTVIPGWTTTIQELGWLRTPNNFNGVTATDGIYSLDFSGFHDFLPGGGVTQTLATVPGQKYVLSFDMSVNTAYGSNIGVTANVGGVSSVFNFDAPKAGDSSSKRVMTFTASAASTALTLSGTAGSQHIGLDNVTVNALTGTQTLAQSLGLQAGASNKQKVGTFAGGEQVRLQFGGNGDLVDARAQVRPDGSLFAPASDVFSYWNAGSTNYPIINGEGDGVNRFVGGGGNYLAANGNFGFAGKTTTNTLDPLTIRYGAVVGTFSTNPGRSDWFYIGADSTITAPVGGGDLYLAVNDAPGTNGDNHGIYTGTMSITRGAVAVPESGTLALALPAFGLLGAFVTRRKTA